MMTKKTKYEAELKKKLENFEPSGYSSNWNGIKNKLPHQGKPFWFKAVVVSGVAAIVAGVIIFSLPNNNENIDTPQSDASSQENHVPGKTPEQNIQSENSHQDNESGQIYITEKADDNSEIPCSDNSDENSDQAGKNEDTHMADNTSESSSENIENEVVSENQSPENISDNTDNADNADNKQPAEQIEKEPQITASINGHCIPAKVKFSTNVDPEKYDIKWYFDDGATSEQQAPEHVYKKPGEYKASLYLKPLNKDESPQRIQSKTITCYGIENPKIYFDKNKNLFTFSTVESGDISCKWVIDERQFNTAVVDYEFKNNGSYPVKLTVSDEHGCTQEVTKKLEVEIEHNYYVPNAFNASSNGVNASFGPVGEDIRSMEYRMLIFDKNGQLIFETDNLNKPWKGFNQRTNQPAEQGVYLWKITTKDKYGNTNNKQGQVTLFRN